MPSGVEHFDGAAADVSEDEGATPFDALGR